MHSKHSDQRQSGKRLTHGLMVALMIGLLSAAFVPVLADDSDEDDPVDIPRPSNELTFRVAFKTELDISSYSAGERIQARLQNDLKNGNKLLAPAGSLVIGHIEMLKRGRHSMPVSKGKVEGAARAIPVFDRIVTSNHEELRIIGIAPEQNSVFSNGECIRQILVGEQGELLRIDDGEVSELEDFGLAMPHSWIPGNATKIRIRPGDQLTILATMPDSVSVSATVVKKSPPASDHQNSKSPTSSADTPH